MQGAIQVMGLSSELTDVFAAGGEWSFDYIKTLS